MSLLSTLTFAAATLLAPAQDHDVRAAPFDAIRWTRDDAPEVRVEGTWYGWQSIDEIEVDELIGFCQDTWPRRWKKRVGEDLVEALVLMQLPPDTTVDLLLVDLENGAEVSREDVPMTEANRRSVLDYNRGEFRPPTVAMPVEVQRVEREHATVVDPRYGYLAEPLLPAAFQGQPSVTRAASEQDLDQLEWLVANTFSYRDLTGVDLHAAFDNVRLGLADEQPLGAFATRVGQLLALFGDGHTRLRGLESLRPGGYLPFLIADAEGGPLAFAADRSGALDAENPFVVALDGEPLERWLDLAGRSVAKGSAHWQRARSLRDLRLWNAQRLEAGAKLVDHVVVTLANAAGENRELRLPLARTKPAYGPWPRTDEHARLEGDIGYLRIPGMESDADFLSGLTDAMESFGDTRGLVIDVRGNGGGSRDALRLLLPYFLDPAAGPRVVNVAAYRLPPDVERGAAEGYLDNRYLYPLGSRRWSEAERAAVQATAGSFTPAWTPSSELFSDWHHMVVAPGATHYDKPVVVLMDTGCFSATDIFLAAFADTTGATLLGTPSGGGSGRSRGSSLGATGLEVRLSSMASFRPGGEPYDGRGIAPDVVVLPTVADHLAGGHDTQLSKALELLR